MERDVFQIDKENYPDQHRSLIEQCTKLALDPSNTIALGVHGDGVPFQKKDSIEVVSWNLLARPTANRIPFTAIAKEHMCKCGCKGLCTWTAVLKVFTWSLLMCFVGAVSTLGPDGAPWEDNRKGTGVLRSGFALGFRALLMQFRGDWPFLRALFRFPAWNQANICWRCRAGPHGSDTPFTDPAESARWRQNRYGIHEFNRMLREAGGALCPLLALPGFSLLCVVLDWLHIVDLGVGADVAGCFFWELITTPGVLAGNTKAERLGDLWQRLRAFYARTQPSCRLDHLTETMVRKEGEKKPKLNVKGGECRHIIPFCAELSHSFAKVNVHFGTIAALFHHLLNCALCISADVYDKDSASQHCRRFCILYCTLQQEALAQDKIYMWQPKPKMHLFQEMVEYMSFEWGSPRHFWCYRDESWCGFWARASTSRGGPKTAGATTARLLKKKERF
jgi:hypothetical protein